MGDVFEANVGSVEIGRLDCTVVGMIDGFLDGALDFDIVTRTVGEDVGGNVEATVGRYEY